MHVRSVCVSRVWLCGSYKEVVPPSGGDVAAAEAAEAPAEAELSDSGEEEDRVNVFVDCCLWDFRCSVLLLLVDCCTWVSFCASLLSATLLNPFSSNQGGRPVMHHAISVAEQACAYIVSPFVFACLVPAPCSMP
jgi:hypothetical protein